MVCVELFGQLATFFFVGGTNSRNFGEFSDYVDQSMNWNHAVLITDWFLI